MFQRGCGDWKEYRWRFGGSLEEVDLHFGRRDRSMSYESAMAEVEQIVRQELKAAQDSGLEYVMFVHGWFQLQGIVRRRPRDRSFAVSCVRKMRRH